MRWKVISIAGCWCSWWVCYQWNTNKSSEETDKLSFLRKCSHFFNVMAQNRGVAGPGVSITQSSTPTPLIETMLCSQLLEFFTLLGLVLCFHNTQTSSGLPSFSVLWHSKSVHPEHQMLTLCGNHTFVVITISSHKVMFEEDQKKQCQSTLCLNLSFLLVSTAFVWSCVN